MQGKNNQLTTIGILPKTRDRLYRMKFRTSYDDFLNELMDKYEKGCEEVS